MSRLHKHKLKIFVTNLTTEGLCLDCGKWFLMIDGDWIEC